MVRLFRGASVSRLLLHMKERLHLEMTRRLNTIYEYGPKMGDAADRAGCFVRIWDTGTTSVVVLTELPDNPGMSVTNACKDIATRVVQMILMPRNPDRHPHPVLAT